MRIAILTPEFPTNSPTGGGLATFLGRLTTVLVQQNCDVEVFTTTVSEEVPCQWNGARVNQFRVPADLSWFISTARYGIGRTLRAAAVFRDSLMRRNSEHPFDIVHGADVGLTNLLVPHNANYRIALRCSSIQERARICIGENWTRRHYYLSWFEHLLIRRADMVYAPSLRSAVYYRGKLGVDVKVIRPPYVEFHTDVEVKDARLPDRFLLHFGLLNRIKGSDILANALQIAWESAPDLKMVWAGTDRYNCMAKFRRLWRENSRNVRWLGPLDRATMHYVLRQSLAVVAPSRTDNLPNNVLEAQAAGIPVIGTTDSSIEEIVVERLTGTLVPNGDAHRLASALIRAWRGEGIFDGRKVPRPPIFEELEPNYAVRKLLSHFEAIL